MEEDNDFRKLGLSGSMLARCKELGFTSPTSVQVASIPQVLRGCNIVANSPTGSGKTMAFVLPIVQLCGKDPHPGYSLVLTPTRELACQIADQFRLVCGVPENVVTVIGGVDFQEQAKQLQAKPLHIIATPGRLADHLDTNKTETVGLLKNLKFLVIDEADRILKGGFDEQLKQIFSGIPSKNRQTLCFSATVDDNVRLLAESFNPEKKPYFYDFDKNGNGSETTTCTDQFSICCSQDYKDGYLIELLKKIRSKEWFPAARSMILFAPTCKDCNIISSMLSKLNFRNAALYSNLPQKERLRSLDLFKSSQVRCLVATDVASRGLDIPKVDLIINYKVPFATDYVHRIGRTGRADRTGIAVTLVTPKEFSLISAIEAKVKKLRELTIPVECISEILKEVLSVKREVTATIDDSPIRDRLNVYKRKRRLMEESDSEESSDEQTMEEMIQEHKKPRRASYDSYVEVFVEGYDSN